MDFFNPDNNRLREHIIELWKFRELIKNLELYESSKKAIISLFISPNSNLTLIHNLLNNKKEIAVNQNLIKKYEALIKIESILDFYSRIPNNGLIILYGCFNSDENNYNYYNSVDDVDDTNKRIISIDFEPFKCIQRTRISIQNKFDINTLVDLIDNENTLHFTIFRLEREKKIIENFNRFSIMNEDRLYRGVELTLKAIVEFTAQTVIVFEDFDLYKITFKNISKNSDKKTFYVPFERINKITMNMINDGYEIFEQVLLLEWLADNYKYYNYDLNILSVENNEKEFIQERFTKIACTTKFTNRSIPVEPINSRSDYEVFHNNR